MARKVQLEEDRGIQPQGVLDNSKLSKSTKDLIVLWGLFHTI